MLENSSLAFFEIQKPPAFMLPTLIKAFSILLKTLSLSLGDINICIQWICGCGFRGRIDEDGEGRMCFFHLHQIFKNGSGE